MPPRAQAYPHLGGGQWHSQWYVVRWVVEPLGWPWLLWWQVGAVAARSRGCDEATDLGAVACSVGAGGGPLGWWCAMATASPANGDGGEREVVRHPKPVGGSMAKFVMERACK